MFKPYTDGKQRFAIKTFKTGTASVLVATLFLTLGLTTVSADEQQATASAATATALDSQEAADQQTADQLTNQQPLRKTHQLRNPQKRCP